MSERRWHLADTPVPNPHQSGDREATRVDLIRVSGVRP